MTEQKTFHKLFGKIFGRMISHSKSAYRDRYPDNVVVFNGNVCNAKGEKLWYGDLDITKEREELQRVATELGEDLYILREMDGRFENEGKPLLENAVAVIKH